VSVEVGSLKDAVDNAEKRLAEKQFAQCFMHGTTGSVLQNIFDTGIVNPPDTAYIGHDFGPGIYCFKDNLRWVLSFALDRCWPHPPDPDDLEGYVHGDNPSIVLFPNSSVDDQSCFNVDKEPIDKHLNLKVKLKLYEQFRGKWTRGRVRTESGRRVRQTCEIL